MEEAGHWPIASPLACHPLSNNGHRFDLH